MTMYFNMQPIYLFHVPESARSIDGFDPWPYSNSVTQNLRRPVILASLVVTVEILRHSDVSTT